MTYHSDYDTYGFRRDEILSILEKHGIILDIGECEQAAELPPTTTSYPKWKQALARRKRLSVFEAACAMGGIDPFTEAETVEHYGVNVAAFDMNKALLDEAIDDSLMYFFEKKEGNFTQTLVDAEDFSSWCDSIGLERPLPWVFERATPLTDASLLHEVEDLRQKLAQADKDMHQLRAVNERLSIESLDNIDYKFDIKRLEAENTQLQAEIASTKPALSGGLSFRYETSLLKLVAAVQDRYLSETYDPLDLDTRPRKDDIISWLQERDVSLSTASASAVDRVAMPFNRSK